ncbi:MAG: HD-GYP domain-containing protein [Chitinivibrionales bacterium]|nr:HD-GYP domain-containing protein [Chitinivibrionales bacterium]
MEKSPLSPNQIPIEELQIGMYVEDVYDSFGTLLISDNHSITTEEQIEVLKKRGVRVVRIDPVKSSSSSIKKSDQTTIMRADSPGDSKPEDAVLTEEQKREQDYYKESKKAKVIYKQSMDITVEALRSAKKTNAFSMKRIRNGAEHIVQSVLRNPDALVSLTQIKGIDEYTFTHSVNVCILTTLLATLLGYNEEELLEIGTGGLLHDIGKMQIPDRILNKPGKLTDAEFRIMKNHPMFGMEIVGKKANVSDYVKTIIMQHHERFDGSGYPYGLSGNQIHEVGLIAAVADVYDAITSDRVYKSAETPQKALATLFQNCDKEYSRHIVEIFTKHLGIYPVGSFVRLMCGVFGIVTRVEKGHLLTPRVLILFDKEGRKIADPTEVDLTEKLKEPGGHQYKIEVSLNPKKYGVNIGNYLNTTVLTQVLT